MRALVAGVVHRIDPVSTSGALSGTLFFACSLTPSLLPLFFSLQSIISLPSTTGTPGGLDGAHQGWTEEKSARLKALYRRER